jgi:hypothetical protein
VTGSFGESALEGESAVENGLPASVRSLNVFDGLALVIVLTLVGIGFLIGTIGGGESGVTTTVELTITPDDQVRPLLAGKTKTFPLYINNPTDYGVRVASISAGDSTATAGGCPAGTLYSAPVEGPTGFIRPGGIRTYEVSVTMEGNLNEKCKGQTFTLPLIIKLASPAADRSW